MQVNKIYLQEWEKVIGKVEAISFLENRVRIVLSTRAMLLELPKSEVKFAMPREGMNVGIVRSAKMVGNHGIARVHLREDQCSR